MYGDEISEDQVRVGSVVEFSSWDSSELQRGTVAALGEKNGRPLVDIEGGAWRYLHQITRVITY